jgi:hypothetical protein
MMDLVTVMHSEGSNTAGMDALTIQTLLESNGIPTVMVGDSVLPNLPFQIKVAAERAQEALELIAVAEHKTPKASKAATGG